MFLVSQCSQTSNESSPLPEKLEGRRIVSIHDLIAQIQSDRHTSGTGCTFMDSDFTGEHREGFSSLLRYKCRICNYVTTLRTDSRTSNASSINHATVIGALAGGGGYTTLSEFAAATNVPCMSQSAYTRYENELSGVIQHATLQSMLEAGAQEKEIAIQKGSVDRDGVPLVTVLCDGMWGTRTYKNKYNSQSGTVSNFNHTRTTLSVMISYTFPHSCQNLLTSP